jgi:hypothetical protein
VVNTAAKPKFASVQQYSFKGNSGVHECAILLENLFLSGYVAEIQATYAG